MAKSKKRQPDYGNRYSKQTIYGNLVLTVILACATVACYNLLTGQLLLIVLVIGAVGVVAGIYLYSFYIRANHAFSYASKKALPRRMNDSIIALLHVPDGAKCLDVGCNAGDLSIQLAKNNPEAQVIGVDLWDKHHSRFSLEQCRRNAHLENITNVSFAKGSPAALPFDDESFDVVTSHEAYHRFIGADHQKMALETLRTLRKGGSFVLYDVLEKKDYKKRNELVKKLKDLGYEQVELKDANDGTLMTKKESRKYHINRPVILYGRK